MAPITYLVDGKRQPQRPLTCPKNNLIAALVSAQSRQYAPIAPSPLNPTCNGDMKIERQADQQRRTRSKTRKPPEISLALRLLRRKAAIAKATSLLEQSSMDIVANICETPAHECQDLATEQALPAIIIESGPLIHVVVMEDIGHNFLADPEKQAGSAEISVMRRWQNRQQRLRFPIIMCLMSACLTLLTVLGLDSWRYGQYLAR